MCQAQTDVKRTKQSEGTWLLFPIHGLSVFLHDLYLTAASLRADANGDHSFKLCTAYKALIWLSALYFANAAR